MRAAASYRKQSKESRKKRVTRGRRRSRARRSRGDVVERNSNEFCDYFERLIHLENWALSLAGNHFSPERELRDEWLQLKNRQYVPSIQAGEIILVPEYWVYFEKVKDKADYIRATIVSIVKSDNDYIFQLAFLNLSKLSGCVSVRHLKNFHQEKIKKIINEKLENDIIQTPVYDYDVFTSQVSGGQELQCKNLHKQTYHTVTTRSMEGNVEEHPMYDGSVFDK